MTIKLNDSIGLTPMEGKIVVRPESDEEIRSSGIVIAQTEKKRQRTGHVVVVDSENQHNLSVGDRIIFDQYGPHEITHDGVELLIIDTYNTDIWAVLNTNAEVNVHGEE